MSKFIDWGRSQSVAHDGLGDGGPVVMTCYWLRIGSREVSVVRERRYEVQHE